MSLARIGFVIDRWEPARGGAERALGALAQELERRGVRVVACARSHAADAPGEHVRVRAPFGWTRGARERALGHASVARARAEGCEVTIGVRHVTEVDVSWSHGGSHARSHAAWRAARAEERRLDARGARQVPVPAAEHDVAPPLRGRHAAFERLERELYERGGARRVWCPSHAAARELRDVYPALADRLCVVGSGIDLERFHPRERAQAGRALRERLQVAPATPLISFSARQPTLKGLPTLLAALARMRAEPWTLLVAGPRDDAQWRERARASGLGDERVRVVSEVDSVALASAADVCAHPTWRDTFGLVVAEALACGTPVVTTACAGAAEHVCAAASDRLRGGEAMRGELMRGEARHSESPQGESPQGGESICGSVLERAGDELLLEHALRRQLARVGSIDHAAVRDAACLLDQTVWLDGLVRELDELRAPAHAIGARA